jgi:hypothetical protein
VEVTRIRVRNCSSLGDRNGFHHRCLRLSSDLWVAFEKECAFAIAVPDLRRRGMDSLSTTR